MRTEFHTLSDTSKQKTSSITHVEMNGKISFVLRTKFVNGVHLCITWTMLPSPLTDNGILIEGVFQVYHSSSLSQSKQNFQSNNTKD